MFINSLIKIKTNEKKEAIEQYKNKTTNDDPSCDYNNFYGVKTGDYGDKCLVVIDLDNKDKAGLVNIFTTEHLQTFLNIINSISLVENINNRTNKLYIKYCRYKNKRNKKTN